MSRQRLTPDQLVHIYTCSQAGLPHSQIALEVGINPATVATTLRYLNKYLSGKTRDQVRRSRSYTVAIKLIRKHRLDSQPSAAGTADRFIRLKQSFEVFQQAISAFIESHVEQRHAELLSENQRLREENEQLKKKSEAQTSLNWIDELQRSNQKETA